MTKSLPRNSLSVGQHRARLVARGILLRPLEIALGVVGVVQRPIRHRRTGDAGTKHLRRLEHQHERHVAAVAPAPHADARAIDVLCEPSQRAPSTWSATSISPQPTADRRLKCGAAKCAAAVVELEDDVARPSQYLSEAVARPVIEHPLNARARHTHRRWPDSAWQGRNGRA